MVNKVMNPLAKQESVAKRRVTEKLTTLYDARMGDAPELLKLQYVSTMSFSVRFS